jgi:2-C-methyl-D-erythritol 4-phosphate cytidylyltransferase
MTSAIIVAAGKGTRMGSGMDKLFLEVAGRPLVAHTWQRFEDSSEIQEIILVVREGMENEFRALAKRFGFTKQHRFAIGGKERQDSVWNGLHTLNPNCEIVAIQDGARPCTSHSVISETIAAAREIGAAVAAQKVTDTLKEAGENQLISRNIDRSKLWAVQTPQVFKKEIITRALSQVFEQDLLVTDDTAACELIGQSVKLVESKTPNPKVTSPADLPLIELLLSQNDYQRR